MRKYGVIVYVVCVWASQFCIAAEMGTVFTYQGELTDGNAPANGEYDLTFTMHDAMTGGSKVGSTIIQDDVSVENGVFTVYLNFGVEVFKGAARYLEVSVRPGAETNANAYITLPQRQAITACPYALQTRGIYVDENKNVGIGTTDPKALLTVSRNNNLSGRNGEILRLVSDINYGYIHFRENTTQRAFLGFGDEGSLLTGAIDNSFAIDALSSALHLAVDSNAKRGITVDTHGKVGIGTTAPAGLLELSSTKPNLYFNRESDTTDSSGMYWRSSGDTFEGAFVRNNASGDFELYSNVSGSTPRMVFKESGQLGVGTENPTRKLHVVSAGYEDGMEVTGSTGKQLFRVRQNSDGNGSIYSRNLNLSGVFWGDRPQRWSPFPRPAYDSGRKLINKGQALTLTHNIGGDPENYVVDLWFYGFNGRNNRYYGGFIRDVGDWLGVYWEGLTGSQIKLVRADGDPSITEVRVRIWVYN